MKKRPIVGEGKPYHKSVRVFRKKLLRLLHSLAERGCGDGGWCECLLCRIMRVVQTEQFRSKPKFKSSYGWGGEQVTSKTSMVNWRGGTIEFAMGSKFESVADEPWYAIKLIRSDGVGWIYWLDYAGPPYLYLTKKAAMRRAKQLREQYTKKPHYEGSYRRVEVVKVGELPS